MSVYNEKAVANINDWKISGM